MLARLPLAVTPAPTATLAGSPDAFAPPLVVFVVLACLVILLVALAISRAKRDVSIDLTVFELRR